MKHCRPNLFQFCPILIRLLQLIFKYRSFGSDDKQLSIFIFNLYEIVSHWMFELEWTGTTHLPWCSYVSRTDRTHHYISATYCLQIEYQHKNTV